ncbi:hypothetical protein EZV73_00450 [Acidaminobacter sp. JC074]|uniref:hypothetical protein n=1 Tax=Acidaminobacter sp. JC074 TaxID=2530199 RepID=UPI001F0FD02F|nr:hypothetical protein [Acidaminobacter sp. JC074]MCH4886009.1 hypothetical protein [Acidaminobacter sp. JC074]
MWTRKKGIESLHEVIGGQIIEGKWGNGPFIVIPYKSWHIIFDYFVVSTGKSAITYTRLRAAFKNPSQFELKLSKEGVFSKIGKALGGQDIQIGDELFDHDYIVKSNDELMATRLLNHHELKSRIDFHKSFHLDLIHKNQMGIKCLPDESALSFMTAQVIKDEHAIKKLVELFEVYLDVLVELDITGEETPSTHLIKGHDDV